MVSLALHDLVLAKLPVLVSCDVILLLLSLVPVLSIDFKRIEEKGILSVIEIRNDDLLAVLRDAVIICK